ncbi:Acyl-CoA dehydrogenase, middle domain [Blastococcus fimeti]|nr:Acyl-CoA dehydrogenase, middle domain [Blastococcus fimeti]
MPATHEVTNQVPPLTGHDPIAGDAALAEACVRHADRATLDSLAGLGRLAGSEQAQEWGRLANEHPPRLRTHDRYGHRIDEVEFHPAWHELMRTAVENGLAGAPWRAAADGDAHAHVRRAVGYLGWTQVEMGHGCPTTMTYAVVPALRRSPELAARFEPGLTASAYEFGLTDPAGKRGLVAGMGMTEKQGGSDVRANTTRAVPQPDGSYRLTGHKWFTSAPMSDLFLVLAQLDEGVSCFLVPRVLPDGERNVFHVQRLKDKLGDRSNASSEVEFDGTTGWLVGEPGRGVPAIIEMVNMTLLTAGERGRGAFAAVREADRVERRVDRRPDPVRRQAGVLQPEGDVVTGAGHHELGVGILEDHRRPGPGPTRLLPADGHLAELFALVRPEQPGEGVQQGGLARARGAGEQHPFPGFDPQVDVARGPGAPAGVAEPPAGEPHGGRPGADRRAVERGQTRVRPAGKAESAPVAPRDRRSDMPPAPAITMVLTATRAT